MNGGTALAPRRVPGHGQVWSTQIYANDRFGYHLIPLMLARDLHQVVWRCGP